MAGTSYQDYLKSLSSKEEDLSYKAFAGDQVPEDTGPSIESEYLDPYVYPALEKGAETVNALVKPIQYASAPFVQAGTALSNLIQGKPQEELINPITHPLDYANKYGSTETFMKTLPIGNEPISDMLPETSAGNYLKKEFPKASSLVRSVSPNNIASMAGDVMIGTKITPPVVAGIDKSTKSIMRYGEEKLPSMLNKETLADQIISGHATDRAMLNDLKNSGKFDEVRDFFLAHPELNKVKSAKALDQLSGEISSYADEYGRQKYNRQGGLISDLNAKQSQFVNEIPVNKRTEINSADIQRSALEHLDEMDLTQRSRASAEKFIREEVPVYEENALNQHPVDYADRLRKNANKLMKDSTFTSDGIERSAQESAAMATEKAARGAMDEAINLMPDEGTEAYRGRQQELSNSLRMKDLYSKARVDGKGPSVPVGNIDRGIVRQVLDLKPRYIDPTLLDMAQARSNGVTPLQSTLKTAQQAPEIAGATTAVPNIMNQYTMRRSLVENLADYEIPRSVDKILNNKQAVLAKIAQVTNSPAVLDTLNDALNKHPDKLSSILPALTIQFPNLFETDKYNRIDGKILDPMLKQKAYMDIENRGDLSNTEKVLLQNGLNRDGSLPDNI